jgi:hypothetical protein
MASPFTALAKAASSSKRENASDHFVDSAAAFGHFRLDAKTVKCSKRTNAEKNKKSRKYNFIEQRETGKQKKISSSVQNCSLKKSQNSQKSFVRK